MTDVPANWRDRLNRAYAEGRALGGAPCCGTRGVDHLPLCGVGVDGVNRMTLRRWLGLP
jgi:hypothetical protein